MAQARSTGLALEDYVLTLVEQAARPAANKADIEKNHARAEAVRRMLEFGERNRLNLGEQVTRDLLHEGHRF